MSATNATSTTRAANALRWISLLGIVAIAVMRMLIVFAPELYFDVDPAFDPNPMGGLGPAGSLLLDGLLLLSAACGMLGEWLGRRGIEWKLFALALLPLPVVMWHAQTDFFHLWRGMTWQSAFIAAVVIAHLSRDRTMRTLIIALLIAAVAPLLARGVSQVTIEHAQTIAAFEEHREAYLRDRGWDPDSSNALIYERRLRQPQPLGWFSTTNIFATTLLPLLALGTGLALGLRQAKLPSGWMGLMALLALMSLIGIWLTGSKGAMLIALITLALVLIPLASSHLKRPLTRLAPTILLALPFLALAGVLVRGFLPEGFLGDRSLLFRWHYVISSAGIFADAPFIGVGPDGYQEAYTQHRLPRNPEEVASAHSMFIDWLCTLGLLSMAWCGLLLTWVLRAGARLIEPPEFVDGLDMDEIMQRTARAAALLVVIAFVPAIMAELHVLGAGGLAVRLIGAVTFAGVALAVMYVMLNNDRLLINWSFAVAAGVIVMHGQIDMSFFQPGFIVWGLCLLGAAGSASMEKHQHQHRVGWLPAIWPVLTCALALWIAVSAVIPAMKQSQHVRAAATTLHPLSEHPQEAIKQRQQAHAHLLDAYDILPRNRLPLHRAVQQLQRAGSVPNIPADQRTALLTEALSLADRLVREHPRTSPLATRGTIAMFLALTTEDEEIEHAALATAIDDARRITERDPHGISGWQRLGHALWLAGRHDEAAAAYHRALRADRNFELDPLKQLTERERQQLHDRMQSASMD